MGDAGMKFDNIGWEDMEGGNSIEIMRTFVKSCRSRQPIQQRENKPYDSSSVVKAFQIGLYKLKTKFPDEIHQNPCDYFPDNAVAQCKKEPGEMIGAEI
jgi:hypothetical protein